MIIGSQMLEIMAIGDLLRTLSIENCPFFKKVRIETEDLKRSEITLDVFESFDNYFKRYSPLSCTKKDLHFYYSVP